MTRASTTRWISIEILRKTAAARPRRRRLDRPAVLQAVDGRRGLRRLGRHHRQRRAGRRAAGAAPRRGRHAHPPGHRAGTGLRRSRTPPKRWSSSARACCRPVRRGSRARSASARRRRATTCWSTCESASTAVISRSSSRTRRRRSNGSATPGSRSAGSSSVRRSTCRCRGTPLPSPASSSGSGRLPMPPICTRSSSSASATCATISISPTRSNGPAIPKLAHWRIHFHVPLFAAEYDQLGSTQPYVAEVLRHMLGTGATTPSGDRNLYLGRAASRPEGGPARLDRPRIRLGAADGRRAHVGRLIAISQTDARPCARLSS